MRRASFNVLNTDYKIIFTALYLAYEENIYETEVIERMEKPTAVIAESVVKNRK